jgi:hypothetical protein
MIGGNHKRSQRLHGPHGLPTHKIVGRTPIRCLPLFARPSSTCCRSDSEVLCVSIPVGLWPCVTPLGVAAFRRRRTRTGRSSGERRGKLPARRVWKGYSESAEPLPCCHSPPIPSPRQTDSGASITCDAVPLLATNSWHVWRGY